MSFRIAISLLLLLTSTAGVSQPLSPVDTSNPRATMQSFITLTKEAADRYAEFRESPSPATQNALWHISDKAERLFDLSQVAPANHRKIADETFYLLWEVMARLELPNLEDIPDTPMETSGEEEIEQVRRWRIPGTEITIVRIEEGPSVGEYLFSSNTVKHARRFYEVMRDQPYLQPMPIKNVYRINQLITGWMIPITWVEALPDWLNYTLFGQILWKWFLSLLLIGLGLGVVIAVYRWTHARAWGGFLVSYLRHLITPLSILIVLPLIRYLTQQQLNITGAAIELTHYVLFLSYGITLVWFVWLTASQVGEIIIASPRIKAESLNASLIRLISRTVGMVAVVILIIRILTEIGVPVYGLVTGAGVGGIAIALAAKSTLENFMGALNLFADHPVGVGDLCRYDEDSTPGWRPVGWVESIGLRSTKIRRFDRTLITIPNAEFAQRNIVNLSACDRFLLTTTLGLRYETTDNQMRFVLAELRELFQAHPKTIHTGQDPLRVRFIGFGDYSLNVAVRAYIASRNYNEFLAIQEDILLRVMKIIKQAGTGFAFPSRTLYHTRDGGLDEERQQAAEKQVREWASAHDLPFPDFREDYRKQIEDTLDYPPEGSPEADSS